MRVVPSHTHPVPVEHRARRDTLPSPRSPSVSIAPGIARPAAFSFCPKWRCPTEGPGPPPPRPPPSLARFGRELKVGWGPEAPLRRFAGFPCLSRLSAVPRRNGGGLAWESSHRQSGTGRTEGERLPHPVQRQRWEGWGALAWETDLEHLLPPAGLLINLVQENWVLNRPFINEGSENPKGFSQLQW